MELMNTTAALSAEEQARELHKNIVYNYRMAADHLVQAARYLKEMRDTKAYLSLGMESFDQYTEKMAGIKARQAYTYISALERLGQPMMEENAGLGITKLSLLAEITPAEREDFVADHDLAGMTVNEVKELVAENTRRGEQLDLFAAKEQEMTTKMAEKDDTIEDLLLELEALKATAKPTEVTATVEPDPAILKQREREIKEKLQKSFDKKMETERRRLQKEVDDAKKTAQQAEEEKAAAEQRIRQEMTAAYEEQLEGMRKAVAAAETKASAGQNELVQKFAFHFEAVQHEFSVMMDLIDEAEDADTANRLTGAALKLVRQMEKRFGGEGG